MHQRALQLIGTPSLLASGIGMHSCRLQPTPRGARGVGLPYNSRARGFGVPLISDLFGWRAWLEI